MSKGKKIIETSVKLLLLLAITFFTLLISLFIFAIYMNSVDVSHTAKIFIEQELDIERYSVHKKYIEWTFIEPRGEWWLQLDNGFDLQKFKKTTRLLPGDKTKDFPSQYLKKYWGFNKDGFEHFYAEKEKIDLGEYTLCPKIRMTHCEIDLYAKDGDRNLFIRIYVW